MGDTQFALAGFKGLRSDLLVALRKEQPLTAGELGVRFGLTANALRRHLKELEDAGLVRFRREVRGVGGPVYAYSLTERGEQLFPRSYANPLADALEVVRAEQGPEGVVRIFRRRWEAVADEASQAGAVSEASDGKDQEYIFKGISGRAFERKFSLADYVEVERASCDNGLLQIDLVRRIPDPMKPRAIAIEAGTPASNVASLKAA